jgi:hypothetical protein
VDGYIGILAFKVAMRGYREKKPGVVRLLTVLNV